MKIIILFLVQLLVLVINSKPQQEPAKYMMTRQNSRMDLNEMFHEIPTIDKNMLARALPDSPTADDMDQIMDRFATDPKNTIPLVNKLLRYF